MWHHMVILEPCLFYQKKQIHKHSNTQIHKYSNTQTLVLAKSRMCKEEHPSSRKLPKSTRNINALHNISLLPIKNRDLTVFTNCRISPPVRATPRSLHQQPWQWWPFQAPEAWIIRNWVRQGKFTRQSLGRRKGRNKLKLNLNGLPTNIQIWKLQKYKSTKIQKYTNMQITNINLPLAGQLNWASNILFSRRLLRLVLRLRVKKLRQLLHGETN